MSDVSGVAVQEDDCEGIVRSGLFDEVNVQANLILSLDEEILVGQSKLGRNFDEKSAIGRRVWVIKETVLVVVDECCVVLVGSIITFVKSFFAFIQA